ncbi:acylphosphatase [Nitzschia inconspicua]|uniref:Acylphosphatase n=1 Tax=Nitzschia inconspicua TaxID=303405 RepID=A0A9K3L1Y3_9STRA|nr:acylphosphatase [Nitzschia inconspicua]
MTKHQHSTLRRKIAMTSFLLLGILLSMMVGSDAFVMGRNHAELFRVAAETASASSTSQSGENMNDPNEIVARRIVVEGDVQGGYYRSCVLNEAGRFRRLTGTMSPPDDSKTAEIYVEGKRKMVDGFVRWCKRSNIGLSQVVKVTEITEADPTGLYDSFYCKTR